MQTATDATTCTPTLQMPEQVSSGETLTISWDLCGAPFVEIDYPRMDVVVSGPHPRAISGNPGNHVFAVTLLDGSSPREVTFIFSNPFTDMRVAGNLRITAP